jgi:hypothetical protein
MTGLKDKVRIEKKRTVEHDESKDVLHNFEAFAKVTAEHLSPRQGI